MAKPRIKKKFAPVVTADAPGESAPKPVQPAGPKPSRVPWFVLPAVLAALAVYANTLDGQFVYDDTRQIVRNTLIQDSAQFWRAIFSDVWAFKGGSVAASNYWRPSFVFWLIVNARMFGVEDASGWHLLNVVLHAGVVLIAFFVARRFDLPRPAACAVALLFAVHPVHTESVAWISGSPDLILAAALLGSLWFATSLADKATGTRWAWALGLYAVALGAKEVAVLYPAVVFAAVWVGRRDGQDEGVPLNRALAIATPFAVLAAAYFLIRFAILGAVSKPFAGGAGFAETILSAPAVFAFYLRQIVFPYWIGPSYPLRAVTASTIGLANFAVPAAVSLAALAGMYWAARRAKRYRVAVALFLVPLVPAMNIGAFQPEQIVHDRYLYLPLFGFLLLVVSLASEALATRLDARKAAFAVLVASAICAAVLSVRTIAYNRAWMTELALWERAVETDPGSGFNFQQYAVALDAVNRNDEAREAYNRAIAINPMPNSLVGRGRVAVEQQRYAEAEADFRQVIDEQRRTGVDVYTLYQAYESLAICYEQQRDYQQAADSLVKARRNLPVYAAALTEKIAVVYYQAGLKKEALAELEAHRAAARAEPLPESKAVIFRLGLLYAEFGRGADAKTAFQEYLNLTAGYGDALSRDLRAQALAAVRSAP